MQQTDHDLLIRLQEQIESLRKLMESSLRNLEDKIENSKKHRVPIEDFIKMKTEVNENTSMRKLIYGSMGVALTSLAGALFAIMAWAKTL